MRDRSGAWIGVLVLSTVVVAAVALLQAIQPRDCRPVMVLVSSRHVIQGFDQ
jgi:hypothetical protein